MWTVMPFETYCNGGHLILIWFEVFNTHLHDSSTYQNSNNRLILINSFQEVIYYSDSFSKGLVQHKFQRIVCIKQINVGDLF